MIPTNKHRFVPLAISVGVVVGILLGSFFANHFSGNRLSIINNSSNKIIDLFHLIDDQYVDSVNIPDLVERSLPQILKELDPHSTYISAADVEASMQDLKGSFSGIGVQFTIYRDTIRIVKVVKGAPSEGSGLQAGDCIVAINGEKYVGDTITNDGAMRRLKGPKGSDARLQVKRRGVSRALSFTISRGDVPIKTVDATYQAAPAIGYIHVNSFGDTTYPEFLAALAKLQKLGFKNLIIDLRGNSGGYMETAVQMANEFLPKNSLIVYTEGRKSPRKEYRTDGRGTYQSMPLTVLVDETSASASEIFAGAIQDNDRGTIIGRRTFGKGLVQVPIEFPDGSMLRLTTARYYTPSGRCVQKPYKPGEEENYEADLILRAEHGEYYSSDSIHTSGQKYHTRLGRVVYGGGGIIPDRFIARDTTGITNYFKEAYLSGLLYQYAYDFVDQYRKPLSNCNDLASVLTFVKQHDLVHGFANYAAKAGLKRRNLMIARSEGLIRKHITAAIVSDLLDNDEAVEYVNYFDPAVTTAINLLRAGKAFPAISTVRSKGNGQTAYAYGLTTHSLLAMWQPATHTPLLAIRTETSWALTSLWGSSLPLRSSNPFTWAIIPKKPKFAIA